MAETRQGVSESAAEIAKRRTSAMGACGSGASDRLLVNITLIWQR